VEVLARACGAAERADRRGARLRRREPVGDEAIDLDLQVRVELGGEILSLAARHGFG
jgi:hypothetical protein